MFLPIQNVIQRQNAAVKFQLWELPARLTPRRYIKQRGAWLSGTRSRPGFGRPSRDERHLASRMPTVRSLDGTARDAADESIKEKIIGDGYRHASDQRRAHQFAPVEDIAADEVGRDAQRHRLLVRRRDESQSVDELLHGEGE